MFDNVDRNIKLLNIHYAFLMTAWQMLNLFSAAYLYKIGVPLPIVFACVAAIYFARMVVRPFSMMMISKIGPIRIMRYGALVLAFPSVFIIGVKGLDIWLLLYILVTAIADVLYWLPYHTCFASFGAAESRGASLGMREAFSKIASIFGPLLSGTLLALAGPVAAFGAAATLMLISFFPLLKLPDLPPVPALSKPERKNVSKEGMRLFISMGLVQIGTTNAWPIILFLLLNESYGDFGWLLSLAAFFTAIGSALLGKKIDSGKGKQVYLIGIALMILLNLGRAAFAYDVPSVIAFDLFASIAICFYTPSSMAAVYNLSKRSSNPLYFQYYAEVGWDISTIFGTLVCALLVFYGFDLRWALVMAAFACVITGRDLHGYYSGKGQKS